MPNLDNQSSISSVTQGRKRVAVAQRERFTLPSEEFKLPAPDALPSPPAPLNLLMSVLPPAIMIVGTVVVSLLTGQANWGLIAPMLIMSLGFPLASIINQNIQQKNYRRAMLLREEKYRAILKEETQKIEQIVGKQRFILETEYPRLASLGKIVQAKGRNPRLWWRLISDNDFLSLRVGSGAMPPSFPISEPKYVDNKDPLIELPAGVIKKFQRVPEMPVLVDMKDAGSLMVTGQNPKVLQQYVNRLLLDILVHHSPEDINLAVLCDKPDAQARWGWLKWAPHTRALLPGSAPVHCMNFSTEEISNYLRDLTNEFNARRDRNKYTQGPRSLTAQFVLMDDTGAMRAHPDCALLAAQGYEADIFFLFVGERYSPKTCRARLTVSEQKTFRYIKAWSMEGQNQALDGLAELADTEECETIARVLAGLEVAGGQVSYTLPESVRLSRLLGPDPFNSQRVKERWSAEQRDTELVRFPAGLYVTPTGYETYELDFRPESKGGLGEYNAFLIGAPGSGKSIFLQSLVLASAHRYSPRQLNFLFLDFKAGAAELKKIKDLPHVVGMINDLGPELAERALKALENELGRRKLIFDNAGKITDIWDFNNRFADKALPHLLTVIDEFAEGIKLLPDLIKRLDVLGRQGRAFGMYFLLANQQVNAAVESLKPTVGWNIVLKVRRTDEMSLIDITKPIPPGKGRGYSRVKSDIILFQGAYAGDPVVTNPLEAVEEFKIHRIEPNGNLVELYKHKPAKLAAGGPVISEQEKLLQVLQQAAQETGIPPARPIYLDPIPADLKLFEVLPQCTSYREYQDGQWAEDCDPPRKLTAPLGMLDIPEECAQIPLEVDFKTGDGHLWIVGSPGSGKTRTLVTLLLSLAASHRPDEVQFYILEYGTGGLRQLENLPHTGAVIRLHEQERLERLIGFLQRETMQRTEDPEAGASRPDLFVVINNFAELRASYPDQADEINSLVRTGKGAGIHLVITTNRASELNRNISSLIAMRIVLQLASRDEYPEATNNVNPAPLSDKCEGRGYWVLQGVSECQVASPCLAQDGGSAAEVGRQMRENWSGLLPEEIGELKDEILYEEILPRLERLTPTANSVLAPLGISYEDLSLLASDLAQEIPTWLVLGPRQSGKSNLLMSMLLGAAHLQPDTVEVAGILPRRTPLTRLAADQPAWKFAATNEQIGELCAMLIERQSVPSAPKTILILDDLGGIFEGGREPAAAALNGLASKFSSLHNLYLLAAAMRDELQMQMGVPVVRLIKQGRTGVCFSKDPTDLDWLGVGLNMQQRKMALPPGRGYLAIKGKASLLQTPLVNLG